MNMDRRNAIVSTALVGTVVAVIGFGAGLSSLFGSAAGSASPAGAATPGSDQSAPMPGMSVSTGGSGGSGSGNGYGTVGGPVTLTSAAGSAGTSASTGTAYPTASSSPSSSSSGGSSMNMGSGGAGTCSNQILVNAMLDPFLTHFYRAHLERSPGQQASDLLNVNQYTLTHTVLAEDMIAPAVTAAQNALNGVVPFTNHFYRAHLERSPGQQVNDLLNVNQYVTTHTVLAEDMTAPAVDSLEGSYGC